MKRIKETLEAEEFEPILLVKVSEAKLHDLLPVDFDESDPLSEAEPSISTLVEIGPTNSLCTTLPVIAVYGQITGKLRIEVPKSRATTDVIRGLMLEIGLSPRSIVWQSGKKEN